MVGEPEHPRADGGERVHGEHELDRAVVEPPHDLVLTDLVGDAPGFDGVDFDAHLDTVVTVGVPGLVGQRRLDVDVAGDTVGGLAPRDLSLDPVDPERAHGVAVEVPRDEVPVAETEPEAEWRHPAVATCPVGERRRGLRAHGLEELDQRRRRDDAGDRAGVAEAGRAQLQQRIPPTRIAQVNAGDGEVERDLLVGLERQVGQIERITVDPVPVLVVAGHSFGEDGDALVPQEALVPLERLAAGRVLGRIPRDLVRDGVEGERARRLEQHEHEIGDALEPSNLAGAGVAGVAVAI